MSARTELSLEADFRPPGEDCRALAARITASREFQRASRLCAFLNYVVDWKLAESPSEITEVLIGPRVFGLPIDYNPGDNSIVRTQARTLRDRLERYFRGEGAEEPIVLDIPRDGYIPVFRLREFPETGPPHSQTDPQHSQAEPRPPGSGSGLNRRQWIWLGGVAAGLSGIAVLRALGAIAAGLMGIDPDASNRRVETLPRLAKQVEWVRLSRLPVGPNEITIEHRGAGTTVFTNRSGPTVEWRPSFPWDGKRVFLPVLTVRAGETRTAKLP